MPPSLTRDIAAAINWWRDAGVDTAFVDDATAWLHEPEDTKAPTAPENGRKSAPEFAGQEGSGESAVTVETPRANLLGESPPESLETFRQFWLEAPGLDGIGPRGRIAPRGNAGAEVMVLVVDPEEGDRETLLGGSQGRLVTNMLKAMGVNPDQAYIASALPRHTPMADTQVIAQGGMDDVLALHITLAKPKRVIAFGANILPLIGHARTKDVTSLREINHGAATTPLLLSEGLDALMSMPRLKAKFWRRWMEWSAQI